MARTLNTVMKTFFWFAFASFLAASIPHVAYFFRSFEPQNEDVFYWIIAYAIAISIDVMILLLSVTVAQLRHQRVGWVTIISVWAFIIALCGLSWFINWQYARQFSGTMLNQVTGVQFSLWFANPRVGDIDPAIASMFQVFAIAYTYIADKIAMSKPKTATQLKEEADEEEARNRELARLEALRTQKRQRRVTTLVGTIQHVSEQVQSMRTTPDESETLERVLQFFRELPHLLRPENAALADKLLKQFLKVRRDEVVQLWRMRAAHLLAQETGETRTGDGQISERETRETGKDGGELSQERRLPAEEITDQLRGANSFGDGDLRTETTQDSDTGRREDGPDTENLRIVAGVSSGNPPDRKAGSSRSAGPRYLSFDDAALLTGYAVDTLKRMANEGRIKRHPSDKNRLLASSLRGLRNPKRTEKTPVLEAVG